MVSMCTCGHVGDGPNTMHRDTALAKNGKGPSGCGECITPECDCKVFTYEGPVVEYTETKEEIWWRKIKCPKCGREKDELEVMPETGDFGIINEGNQMLCECGFEYYPIEPQPKMKCIHCGAEDGDIGADVNIKAVINLNVQMYENEEHKPPYEEKVILQVLWEQLDDDDAFRAIENAVDSGDYTIQIDAVDKCRDCDKYQTADGEAPKEAILSDYEVKEVTESEVFGKPVKKEKDEVHELLKQSD